MAEQTHRGRAAERTAAILRATLDVLDEVGYDQLTIEAVAARAAASKMTIYRHWGDKPALVAAALRARSEQHPELRVADCLREDLIALADLFDAIARRESAAAFASLLAAAQREPAIAQALRTDAVQRRRADCRDVVQRAIGRGEVVDPSLDGLLFELLVGRSIVKSLLSAQVAFDGDTAGYVDAVLLPVLTR